MSRARALRRKGHSNATGTPTRPVMSDDLFAELRESVRQGGAALRGVREPSRVYSVTPGNNRPSSGRQSTPIPNSTAAGALDVVALRARFNLSQVKFAALLGISVATVRNWEQGRRTPEGPARVLLQVADRDPEAILNTVAASAMGRAANSKRST